MIDIHWPLREEILNHAQSDLDKEICGLIAVVKGRQRYFPRNNIAETPHEHFVLDGWAEVEDKGEIIAVVHSHPKTPPTPSEADRVACEASNVPWVIVNPQTKNWGYCEPSGYKLSYVGREFVHGVVDCYTLVRDWYARELGIVLDDFERRDGWWDKGQNLYLDNFAGQGFTEIPVEHVRRGDLLLMSIASPVPNHAAIYLGDQKVLHHMQGRLSSTDVYCGGTSYYGRSTHCALRHESR